MIENSIQTRRQRGFTLIELISVIIILGILAAVVTPKYFDMTDKANEAVEKGVKSEAVARFNMAYAQYVLDNSASPTALANLVDATNGKYLGTSLAPDVGDYIFTYSGGGAADVTCTITGDAGTSVAAWSGNTVTIPWPR